MSAGNNQCYSQ